MPAAQACRKSLAERVDANDRAFRGFPMAARVASHAPECTELTVEGDRGFESGSLQRGVINEPVLALGSRYDEISIFA
jgi:hypothetical protein